ncbi:alpha/beta hydrolase [Psychroserpens sp. SPM9]|uniref:alpha/beta hydrolase n=1 Tax=Psychroserpens sp. SPM9 TaxID=2975598 RepID=UPI0021A91E07|nr:esterase [Psychroserpens sp. SPM9]MDG5491833.1 esterase [Psychroserpens sp. SPM9]
MNSTEKEISYTISNTYSTLNELSSRTKNIWFVCHGMGYLSRYFLKYFKTLNAEENYIIAPQAQSKYYIAPKLKHVGASWLTKENTIAETENVMHYFDAIFEHEQLLKHNKTLILFGYSQGVSVVMRYMAKRQIQCSQLILHSGGIPKELSSQDFNFFTGKTSLIYGTNDEYLNESRIELELQKARDLFKTNLNIIPFEGVHEVNVSLINRSV